MRVRPCVGETETENGSAFSGRKHQTMENTAYTVTGAAGHEGRAELFMSNIFILRCEFTERLMHVRWPYSVAVALMP